MSKATDFIGDLEAMRRIEALEVERQKRLRCEATTFFPVIVDQTEFETETRHFPCPEYDGLDFEEGTLSRCWNDKKDRLTWFILAGCIVLVMVFAWYVQSLLSSIPTGAW